MRIKFQTLKKKKGKKPQGSNSSITEDKMISWMKKFTQVQRETEQVLGKEIHWRLLERQTSTA